MYGKTFKSRHFSPSKICTRNFQLIKSAIREILKTKWYGTYLKMEHAKILNHEKHVQYHKNTTLLLVIYQKLNIVPPLTPTPPPPYPISSAVIKFFLKGLTN